MYLYAAHKRLCCWRTELLAAGWEGLSALLFASALMPALLRSWVPVAAFVLGLGFSALVLQPHGAAQEGIRASEGPKPTRGRIAVLVFLLRSLGWVLPAALVVKKADGAVLLVACAFGVMAAAVRLAIYRTYEEEQQGGEDERYLAQALHERLARSANTTGIVACHLLMLFMVAFLRTTSSQLRVLWFTALPWLAVAATALFTTIVHMVTPPVLVSLAAGANGDNKLHRAGLRCAQRIPHQLAAVNFGLWITCGAIGAWVRPTRLGWGRFDLVAVLAVALLFAWGVALYQQTWQRTLLAPVVERLRAWVSHSRERVQETAYDTIQKRLLTDFGLPLAFLSALFLFASLGLYATLSRERGNALAPTDVLALGVACLVLTAATASILVRSARDLARPIVQLSHATERVAQGELQAALPMLDAPQEISSLGQSAEAMRQALARTIAELEQERTGLEAHVAERTSELRHALEELSHAQAALLHREKMASLGQLVAGVAHEINNPLTAITGSVAPMPMLVSALREAIQVGEEAFAWVPEERQQLLRKRIEPLDITGALDDLEAMAHVIARAASRGARIVDDLRQVSQTPTQSKPARLEESLDETLILLGPRLREVGVEVTRIYAPLPPVLCRIGEVCQIFMNLLSNAIAALRDCPKRQIEVRTEPLQEGQTTWARVTVDDSGLGVPQALHFRIFDPFFTTKSAGQGTGLGLFLSLQIAEHHGGKLTVAASPLGGARFVLLLPLREPSGEGS